LQTDVVDFTCWDSKSGFNRTTIIFCPTGLRTFFC
jgi:hypothetical protein